MLERHAWKGTHGQQIDHEESRQMTGVSATEATGARTAGGARAGFWRRFGAILVDGILLGIVNAILRAVLKDAPAAYYIVGTLLDWAYATVLEGGRGQTVGKMAFGIRVVDIDGGGPIGYGRAFIRQLVKIASALVIFLGYLWMLWDKENQCWHDKVARDVVVPV
jgi:uncharacterized RDD family membrane protein YckC